MKGIFHQEAAASFHDDGVFARRILVKRNRRSNSCPLTNTKKSEISGVRTSKNAHPLTRPRYMGNQKYNVWQSSSIKYDEIEKFS